MARLYKPTVTRYADPVAGGRREKSTPGAVNEDGEAPHVAGRVS